MIASIDDYSYYLECDKIAVFGEKAVPWHHYLFSDAWKYHVVLRRQELFLNCYKGIGRGVINSFYKYKKSYMSRRTGWYIPPNTFGPGLCIVHYGPVIVNPNCSFGANCRIQAMVNIGAGKDKYRAPRGGNNIYIGPGAKIYGDIYIGNHVAIGANAVVNKSFDDGNITIAGAPARIVSNHGTTDMIFDAVEYLKHKKNSCKVI